MAWLDVGLRPSRGPWRDTPLDRAGARPFAVGALGLGLRVGIPETPVHKQTRTNARVEHGSIEGSGRRMLVTVGLNWVASVGYYLVFVWFSTAMTEVMHLSYRRALGVGTLGLVFGLIATLVMGAISDRIGKKRLLMIGSLATATITLPLFMLATIGNLIAITAAQLGLATLIAIFLGTLPAVFVSLHEVTMRCTNLSISYNIALAIFGGTTPLVATLMTKYTGSSLSPAFYLVLTAIVCAVFTPLVPTTALIKEE